MDQDAFGREVGLGSGHIVLHGDPDPLPQRGTAPNFRSMSIVAKRSPISTAAKQLLKKDVNRFSYAYTGEKFPNFCTGSFHVPKNSQNGYCRGWVLVRGYRTAQTAQFLAKGIIWGLDDIPIMCHLCVTFATGRTVCAL